MSANRLKYIDATVTRSSSAPVDVPDSEGYTLAQLWASRMILYSKSFYAMFNEKDKNPVVKSPESHVPTYLEDYLNTLGITEYPDEFKHPSELEEILENHVAKLDAMNLDRSTVPFVHVDEFADLLGLSKIEADLFALYCVRCLFTWVRNSMGNAQYQWRRPLPDVLAATIGATKQEMMEASSSTGILSKTQILDVDFSSSNFGGPLSSPMFDDSAIYEIFIHRPAGVRLDPIKKFVLPPKPTKLRTKDFDYVPEIGEILLPYLSRSVEEKARGSNILIYGRPGVGKTELVTLIAQTLGLTLNTPTNDTFTRNKSAKFYHYALAQAALKHHDNSIILVDEAEDIFVSIKGGDADSDKKEVNKDLFHRTLEENIRPAIWVCNHPEVLSSAAMRRFDVVLKMPNPPLSVRQRIFRKYTKGLRISQDWINKASMLEGISPADIRTSAKVAKRSGVRPGKDAEHHLQTLLRGRLGLRDDADKELKKVLSSRTVDYDLELANVNVNLEKMIKGLRTHKEGRLYFHGPPGTGKSALGTYISKQLGIPIHAKSASDILSMWVGGTEQNIAAAFAAAERDGAILLLDEIDSLLQGREKATKSWEITQVNELLQQMDRYTGILIACSNLTQIVDQAAFRRFDMKIEFGYLNHQQRVRMFQRTAEEVGVTVSDKELLIVSRDLKSMQKLTPGDFSAISRRSKLVHSARSASDLIRELRDECQYKPNARSVVGFTN